MSIFKKMLNDYEQEYRQKCSDAFLSWFDGKSEITLKDYQQYFIDNAGMNSFERNLMYPKMSKDLVVHLLKHHLEQLPQLCSLSLPAHYGEAVSLKLVPRLLQILEAEQESYQHQSYCNFLHEECNCSIEK